MALGWGQRTGWDPGTMGRLARAAGATEQQVQAWLTGEVEPSTAQASAVMDALPHPATGAVLDGAHR
jgi:hypothetical protein